MQKIGYYLRNKMSKEIDELRRKIKELKQEADRGKVAIEELKKVRAVLGQLGLRTGYGWIDGLEDELKQVLKVGVPKWLTQSVDSINCELRKIKELLA